MAKKRSKKQIKKFWLTTFFVVCIAINAWYMLLTAFAPDKTITNTFNLGLQSAADGSSEYFAEVNYMSNANENGLELFEVNFNYLTDENRTALYSQGMQYVANTPDDFIKWDYYKDETYTKKLINSNKRLVGQQVYSQFGTMMPMTRYATVYNYMSDNNYDRVWESTNPLTNEAEFKVQIGKDIFLMSLKGKNSPTDDLNLYMTDEDDYRAGDLLLNLFTGYERKLAHYSYYDVNFFSYLMYNSVAKAIKPGTSDVITFEIADMFDYQIYKDGQYVDVEAKNIDSVKQKVTNYFSIKVTVSEDGARKASEDSLFGCIHGNSNYNTTGDYSSSDYFYGRTVITVKLEDFNLIYVGDTKSVALKLKEEFINYRAPYKDKIVLFVNIDLDTLNNLGLEYFGFADDHGLDNFEVYKCITTETVDGLLVETEVEYA